MSDIQEKEQTLNQLERLWLAKEKPSFEELSFAVVQTHQLSQAGAVKAINQMMTLRNWLIGRYIVEYEQRGRDRAKYGDRLLKRLEEQVKTKGLNETLFRNSRTFYRLYPQIGTLLTSYRQSHRSDEEQIHPTPSDECDIAGFPIRPTESDEFVTAPRLLIEKLSFSHLVEIMTQQDPLARFFYETECIKGTWSVKELRRQISTNLFFRSGVSKDPEKLLQSIHSESFTPTMVVRQPFTFEFLGLDAKDVIEEKDLEKALIEHLQVFLLEMGKGFCFEARQKRMIIDDEYYYADLVFYNRILHCSVIVELKNDEFHHSDLSQLNAYVSYYKDNEMNSGDNPPIGILLCTRKGKKMVEYALAGMDNNLFVSTYMLTLPTTRQLEDFLMKEIGER